MVFGTSSPSAVLDVASLNGNNGFSISGVAQDQFVGKSVSSAGDINGDGMDDLIIGADGANPNGKSLAGALYVIFGSSMRRGNLDLAPSNGSNGFVIHGANANDFTGRSVSSAGDMNGDGFDDLLIGASGASSNGLNLAGAAYVIFGRQTTTSIKSNIISLPLELIPNPASINLTVKVANLNQISSVSLSVFDVLGRNIPLAYERTGTDHLQLDISTLPQGSYVLRVQIGGETGTARFIKTE